MRLEVADAIEIYNVGVSEQINNYLFSQWLALLPNMSRNNYISFADFKAKAEREQGTENHEIDTRPASEIIAELDEIEKQFERGERK